MTVQVLGCMVYEKLSFKILHWRVADTCTIVRQPAVDEFQMGVRVIPWVRFEPATNTCRDFTSPFEAFAVSDKLSRMTAFFVIKVRPRDATPASTALAECSVAD